MQIYPASACCGRRFYELMYRQGSTTAMLIEESTASLTELLVRWTFGLLDFALRGLSPEVGGVPRDPRYYCKNCTSGPCRYATPAGNGSSGARCGAPLGAIPVVSSAGDLRAAQVAPAPTRMRRVRRSRPLESHRAAPHTALPSFHYPLGSSNGNVPRYNFCKVTSGPEVGGVPRDTNRVVHPLSRGSTSLVASRREQRAGRWGTS